MSINVRLKDASGNVLHPETEWKVIKNRPSIKCNTGNDGETWDNEAGDIALKSPGNTITLDGREIMLRQGYSDVPDNSAISMAQGQISIAAQNDVDQSFVELSLDSQGLITIRDSTTNFQPKELKNYPIEWSAIANKKNTSDGVFGTITIGASAGSVSGSMETPCFCSMAVGQGGRQQVYIYYDYNSGTWKKELGSPENFHPLKYLQA